MNFKRYKFSTVIKFFNTITYSFLKIFKSIDLEKYNLKRIYKSLYFFKKINVKKYISFISNKLYNIKDIKFSKNKFFFYHLPASIIFFSALYLIIPSFYKYDKSDIQKKICNNKKIECVISGKIKYTFFPSPRIKIKNFVINEISNNKTPLIKSEKTLIILSFKNLLAKDQHKFKKIKINKFESAIQYKRLKEYKNILKNKITKVPAFFNKGKIVIFSGKEYVASIDNVKFNIDKEDNFLIAKLKGNFLDDEILINYNRENIDNATSTEINIKMLANNFVIKTDFSTKAKEKGISNGKFLIKKGKNKITGLFDYKKESLNITKSNLRNSFIDGKLDGVITFLPYFDFNLDLNLNSINFKKIYSHFLSLEEKKQKEIFKINNKINGKLNFSADKVYSSYNLIKSFESRLIFNNGNMEVEQLLINLGKLGASDILGAVNNDKKFTNFKFESNIFVDNKKKFLSKFGLFDKEKFPSSFFVSGSFDLENLRASFYEIIGNEKVVNDDINYIEKEFNSIMFEEGYKSLFHFPNLKEFIKSIEPEIN